MKVNDFKCLKNLTINGFLLLKKGENFAEKVYLSNIPFRPGVYLIYSLDKKGEDKDLLYFGKAGVSNKNNPYLNFHQLPERLLAATRMPKIYTDYYSCVPKDITRAKLLPWYVKHIYKNGIKIYWFITKWPIQNPINIEKMIETELKNNNKTWKKSI